MGRTVGWAWEWGREGSASSGMHWLQLHVAEYEGKTQGQVSHRQSGLLDGLLYWMFSSNGIQGARISLTSSGLIFSSAFSVLSPPFWLLSPSIIDFMCSTCILVKYTMPRGSETRRRSRPARPVFWTMSLGSLGFRTTTSATFGKSLPTFNESVAITTWRLGSSTKSCWVRSLYEDKQIEQYIQIRELRVSGGLQCHRYTSRRNAKEMVSE